MLKAPIVYMVFREGETTHENIAAFSAGEAEAIAIARKPGATKATAYVHPEYEAQQQALDDVLDGCSNAAASLEQSITEGSVGHAGRALGALKLALFRAERIKR